MEDSAAYVSGTDFLLRDFGFYHLHLASDQNGRTNELLLVLLQGHRAYFINIVTHNIFKDGKGIKDTLVAIDNDFPELIEPYVMKGTPISDDGYGFTEKETWELGKKNWGRFFNINGKAVCFVDRGPLRSGNYLSAMNKSSSLNEELNLHAHAIKRYHKRIHKKLLKEGLKQKKLLFRMQIGESLKQRRYIEHNTGLQIIFERDHNNIIIPKILNLSQCR